MKKFNADGGFRKDTKKEYNEHDLNSMSGKSLKEATESLDDTILLSDEEIQSINDEIQKSESHEDDEIIR